MIAKCTCKHEYQDEKHGKGMRVFNRMEQAKQGKKYRCTVCERIKDD